MAKERVRDVMSMGVTTLPADRTVTAAARLMEAENVGDVIVMENNGIRGVVTDRDITVRAVDTTGLAGATNSGTGSTAACPPAKTVQAYTFGDANGHIGGSSSSTRCQNQGKYVCKFIGVRLTGWAPGSTHSCQFESTNPVRAPGA